LLHKQAAHKFPKLFRRITWALAGKRLEEVFSFQMSPHATFCPRATGRAGKGQVTGFPGGRAVSGVGLRPLACWDCGFEPRREHGCPSLVSVVCCQIEVSATGRPLVEGSPTECVVCVYH